MWLVKISPINDLVPDSAGLMYAGAMPNRPSPKATTVKIRHTSPSIQHLFPAPTAPSLQHALKKVAQLSMV